jgi:DNA sulfur modification protein DndE
VEHPVPWAFCLSLKQSPPPTPIEVPADSNVEMTWQVFGGEAQELYLALLKERCVRDGLGTADDVLSRQFRLHLHRGISYLATPQAIRSVGDLINLIVNGQKATGEIAAEEPSPPPAA